MNPTTTSNLGNEHWPTGSWPTPPGRLAADPRPPRGMLRPETAALPPQQIERQLLDSIERILRAPAGRLVGWMVLALHLSRLPPPGPRAHHRRVAASVLDDAAARSNGQWFALANGDMALLFRPADGGIAAMDILSRLFQTDGTETALRSLWALPEDAKSALSYIRERTSDGARAAPLQEALASFGAVTAMDLVVRNTDLADLMHRQTAVLLRPGRAAPMVPLFREVAISTAVLEARIAALGQSGASASTDPFLFNYLAARLDNRMLGALQSDVPGGGLLSMGLGAAALHVNMTVSGVLSESFASFAAASMDAIAAGLVIGMEMRLVEAFADPKAFVLARERLRLAGLRLILDGVSHDALMLTSLSVLEPVLVKLDWSTGLPDAGVALRQAIAAFGPERIVLDQSNSEQAIAWGLSQGIRRFQGAYVDRMLAAERLRACQHAGSCTLRQCTERATATGPAGRSGCMNKTLLDLATPIHLGGKAP